MAQRHARASLAVAIALASLQGAAAADTLPPDLRINGFLTAGGTTVSNDFGGLYLDDGYDIEGFDESGTSNFDNVLGLQVGYQLSDKVDLVGQLVSAGQKDYQTNAEWAYVAYQHNDNVRLRAGRFAAPFYMYSESLRVGQAYPWARTPVELYFGIPVKSLDGIDVLYRLPVGDWNFDAQAYFGGSTAAFGRLEKTGGINLNLSSSSLILHAGYGAGKIDFSFNGDLDGARVEQFEGLLNIYGGTMDAQNETVSFADVGAIYDDGNWFAAAEFGQLRINDYANNFDAGYVSVGHYFGKWLPYVTAAKSNAVESDGCYARFSQARTTANTQAATAAAGATALAGAATIAAGNATAAATAAAAAGAAYAGDPTAANLALFNTAVAAATTAQLAATQAGLLANEVAGLAADAALGASTLDTGLQSVCDGKEQTSYSLGFRYDATKNISIKAEVSHVRDFNATTGFFAGASPQSMKDESTQVITFNVNAAF